MKKRAFGTYAIAKICHVAPITVGRWIEEGKVPFFTTGGGHRRVWENDLVKFLSAHNYPIPHHLQSASQPRFLIIDDELVSRRFVRHTLKKEFPESQIEEAGTGYEAGEKISVLMPSVIVLDIFHPGLDGTKICQSIRKNKALKKTMILATTADTKEELKTKILKAGANAVLRKPLAPISFLKTIRKLLEA